MPRTAELHALQRDFAACIRDPARDELPPGVASRRMQVYRELFFNNVEGLLSSNFPVIRTLYAEADWNALVAAFLHDHRAQTPLFPEIGREFLRWLEQRREDGRDDAPFLLELAHYEWAELALALDEHEIAAIAHDVDGDVVSHVPVLSPLAWVLGYRFPVQRIGADFRPAEAPAEPTLLLLIRDRRDEVSFLEINALTAALIERLQANTQASGADVVAALLAEVAPANAAALQSAGEAILRDLQARDALLGTQPT
ncbi:DNA-binding domain-containing protein [Tahibacter caeni]|uniref:HvfC family RiPP maturation protein n=1 Tax=Tahibacter caeni TaxID=1453545 RepID=UPI002147B375|nr:putative DNA-binding domain-containing protein [Tahibacter caeni]